MRILVNHDLINPLDLYVANAPVRNFPTTLPYCCPTAVLEWETERTIILSPIFILTSIIFHLHPQEMSI